MHLPAFRDIHLLLPPFTTASCFPLFSARLIKARCSEFRFLLFSPRFRSPFPQLSRNFVGALVSITGSRFRRYRRVLRNFLIFTDAVSFGYSFPEAESHFRFSRVTNSSSSEFRNLYSPFAGIIREACSSRSQRAATSTLFPSSVSCFRARWRYLGTFDRFTPYICPQRATMLPVHSARYQPVCPWQRPFVQPSQNRDKAAPLNWRITVPETAIKKELS